MSIKYQEKQRLGVVGGMGSDSTAVFLKMLFNKTDVRCDQEHLDIILFNHASLPDRTECILSHNEDSLLSLLKDDIKILKNAGCKYIAIPCNTCHCFSDQLNDMTDGLFIDMIQETAFYAAKRGAKNVGIMATDGVVFTGLYKKALESYGIKITYPTVEMQKRVMEIIYRQIKQGEKGDRDQFNVIVGELLNAGCDCIILACTELSVFKENFGINDEFFVDALEILVEQCIERCGGQICLAK